MMKRGETVCEVHRAGRSRQGLAVQGVPASGDVLACWFCPGGGLETGEGYEQAARRELFEETGIVAEELGPVVLERTVRFTWDGVEFDQTEHYFVVRTSVQEISSDRWTDRGAPSDRGASVVDGRRAPKRQRTRLSGGAHPFGRIGVAMRRPLASDRNGT
jgi:8-oxo-dGTP pyrophosphatase MutT (NUDIX family)